MITVEIWWRSPSSHSLEDTNQQCGMERIGRTSSINRKSNALWAWE